MTDAITLPFTAAAFNQLVSENKLAAAHCKHCGGLFIPPRAICPDCHHVDMEWVELSGHGKLAAYTSIFVGPSFMNKRGFSRTQPYVTGIVELEEGPMISARITGVDALHPDTIQIGMPVSVEFLLEDDGDAQKPVLAFRG